MTPALVFIVGLLLAADAAPVSAPVPLPEPPASANPPKKGAAKKAPAATAKAEPAPKAVPAQQPAPAPAPAASAAAARSAEEAEEGQLLLEQKCARCHDLSFAYSSMLSDAQWNAHMRRMANRPGAAITDEQAKKIHQALKEHRAQAASR